MGLKESREGSVEGLERGREGKTVTNLQTQKQTNIKNFFKKRHSTHSQIKSSFCWSVPSYLMLVIHSVWVI